MEEQHKTSSVFFYILFFVWDLCYLKPFIFWYLHLLNESNRPLGLSKIKIISMQESYVPVIMATVLIKGNEIFCNPLGRRRKLEKQ